MFRSVAATGQSRRLRMIGLSLRGYPETPARAADCLARAKKQPKGPVGRFAKTLLIRLQYNWSRRYFTRHPDDLAMCWNGLTGSRRAFMLGAQDARAARLFAELAPFPGRVTLDPNGVNAEGSVPQEGGFYDIFPADLNLIAATRDGLTARASRRSDVGQGASSDLSSLFLFVPLQVPDDSQIRLFADWVGDLGGFIDALAAASHHLPEGWHFRVKEHPSAKQPLAVAINAHIAAGARLVLDNDTDSFAQLKASRGVVTVNSSMGLQAFLHDKPVIATGRTFWSFDGLACQARSQRDLEQLVSSGQIGFDAELRARFLTWLLTDYYPELKGGAVPAAAARAKIQEAIACR